MTGRVVGAGVVSLVLAFASARGFVNAGHEGAPALVAFIVVTLVSGAVAGRALQVRGVDFVVLVVALTALFWLYQYEYPSGESSPTDWFTRGGWALLACVFVALWGIGVIASGHLRPRA